MHREILSAEQQIILTLVKKFGREYYLAGGTSVALHIGHRRSLDFDLFKSASLNIKKNISRISEYGLPFTVTRRVAGQMNVTVGGVKFTFLEYPFNFKGSIRFEGIIKIPELIDLAAMKAYALDRRSKWKDYVDLYFILKGYYSIRQISARASEVFDQFFSEKLFRARLSYFEDVDYSEEVEYIVPEVPKDEIRAWLTETSLAVDL
jgi:hypothetical protein